MRRLLATLLLSLAGIAAAEDHRVPLSAEKQIVFLGVEQGRAAIVESTHDPFFSSLSAIDAELRLAEPLPDSTPEQRQLLLTKLFQDAVQPWTDNEIRILTVYCQRIFREAEGRSRQFVPTQWKFVKTDGSEEAQAAYTRHDCIVLPQGKLPMGVPEALPPEQGYRLAHLIAHETSHVFTRLHPEIRDRLYARLGFKQVGPIELGDALNAVRITNPDGVRIEHVIEVQHPSLGKFPAALVTYSKSAQYRPAMGRRLFDYLRFGLFPVQEIDGRRLVRSTGTQLPQAFKPDEVTGFFEQIGRNTQYIIHPDEILADNLALLLTANLPGKPASPPADPGLLRDLELLLSQ